MGIGPSTKETSLHHFRDPLLDVFQNDTDIDFVGFIVSGTPQTQEGKAYIASRTAAWLEAMRVDGALVSIDGWGNSHVDFALTFEEIGHRNIPVVGLSFIGTQAKFVVENQYMTHIVDFNKSVQGIETEVVGENNVTTLDARKALAYLKLRMRGDK